MAEFIASQRAEHHIPHAVACRALEVSQPWLYKWRGGDCSARRARRQMLGDRVEELFKYHKRRYGSPRITADLRDEGWTVSKNTVAQLMSERGLVARRRRKHHGGTRPDRSARKAPDQVNRDFSLRGKANQFWCGDLTDIPNDEGPLWLATVEDLHSRRLLGYALGIHHDAELARAALCMAIAVRGGDVHGVVMHTDQGGEFTGKIFAIACERTGVTQSMGRTGSALDNAAAESFNSTLEFEVLADVHFATREQARVAIAEYIEYYNYERRHSTLGMICPVAYEHAHAPRPS